MNQPINGKRTSISNHKTGTLWSSNMAMENRPFSSVIFLAGNLHSVQDFPAMFDDTRRQYPINIISHWMTTMTIIYNNNHPRRTRLYSTMGSKADCRFFFARRGARKLRCATAAARAKAQREPWPVETGKKWWDTRRCGWWTYIRTHSYTHIYAHIPAIYIYIYTCKLYI